jgi:hypothetical protein
LYADAQHPCGVQALSNAIANTYTKVASYVDCINQYLRDLGLCYEAYKNNPAALENCYAAAKKKRDFCLGDIPGPVQ